MGRRRKPGRPKGSVGSHTAKNILDAAVFCISTIGIEHTSIGAIAKRAKKSRSLVAHYFPKKERLFLDVINYISQEGLSSIAAPSESSSGAEKIVHSIRENYRFFEKNPAYYHCISLFRHYAGFIELYREANAISLRRSHERMAYYLRQHLRERGWKSTEQRIDICTEIIIWESLGALQQLFCKSAHVDQVESIHISNVLKQLNNLEFFKDV